MALDALFEYQYREYFHLSAQQFANEPFEAIQLVRAIWSAQHERDKLEAERQHPANGIA